MIYLTYCPHIYATHNKLEEKVLQLLKNNSRRMIYREDVEKFQDQLIHDIGKLNDTNQRCKPVKIVFHLSEDRHGTESVDYFVSWKTHQVCDFKILASK